MTIEANIDTVIELVKHLAFFLAGMVAEALRRWFAAPKKERDEFIDVTIEALKDGSVTLEEGLMVVKEGKDIFIGIDISTLNDDTMGKA